MREVSRRVTETTTGWRLERPALRPHRTRLAVRAEGLRARCGRARLAGLRVATLAGAACLGATVRPRRVLACVATGSGGSEGGASLQLAGFQARTWSRM